MKFKKIAAASLAGLMACACVGCAREARLPVYERGEVETREADASVIADKVLGAWIGSAIGLGSGYEYVTTANNPGVNNIDATVVPGTIAYVAMADKYWEPNGQVCSGSIGVNVLGVKPLNDPRVSYNKVISDDDMHVDVLNQFIFRDNGPDVGAEDIAAAWDYYGVSDVGGGQTVTDTVRNNGYVPPYTGQSAFGNIGYWVTESWIENETLGLVFPYMYETCEAYADLFCTTQGDGLSLYLGRLCALMQCLAYEYEDATVIMEKAFSRMDHYNEIYEIYEFVKSCWESGMNWRDTCVKVVERRVNYTSIGTHDTAGFSISANAGMIFLSLFYATENGKTDFEEAIKICSLCGLDGDCTAATVGGLVGAMYGYEGMPQKYKDFINADTPYYNYNGRNSDEVGVSWGPFAYCDTNFPNKLTFRQIADLTVDNIEAQILSLGGKVEGEKYFIPEQSLEPMSQVVVSNAGFETGDTYGWKVEDPHEKTYLTAVSSVAHLGAYGAVIEVYGESEGRIFQELSLKKGNVYRAEIWVNGLNDREFRFYAKGGNATVYRSVVNPLYTAGRHMKVELCFTAPADKCEVGISFSGMGEEDSVTMFIDDFAIEDLSGKRDYARTQVFEAEDCYMSDDSTPLKAGSASGGRAVNLISGGGLRTDFTGTNGYQVFRIYYKNTDEIMEQALLKVSLDGEKVATLPLVAQGASSTYNEGNFAEVCLAAGTGTHTLKLELLSYYDIQIDKIEITAGNRTF